MRPQTQGESDRVWLIIYLNNIQLVAIFIGYILWVFFEIAYVKLDLPIATVSVPPLQELTDSIYLTVYYTVV